MVLGHFFTPTRWEVSAENLRHAVTRHAGVINIQPPFAINVPGAHAELSARAETFLQRRDPEIACHHIEKMLLPRKGGQCHALEPVDDGTFLQRIPWPTRWE